MFFSSKSDTSIFVVNHAKRYFNGVNKLKIPSRGHWQLTNETKGHSSRHFNLGTNLLGTYHPFCAIVILTFGILSKGRPITGRGLGFLVTRTTLKTFRCDNNKTRKGTCCWYRLWKHQNKNCSSAPHGIENVLLNGNFLLKSHHFTTINYNLVYYYNYLWMGD